MIQYHYGDQKQIGDQEAPPQSLPMELWIASTPLKNSMASPNKTENMGSVAFQGLRSYIAAFASTKYLKKLRWILINIMLQTAKNLIVVYSNNEIDLTLSYCSYYQLSHYQMRLLHHSKVLKPDLCIIKSEVIMKGRPSALQNSAVVLWFLRSWRDWFATRILMAVSAAQTAVGIEFQWWSDGTRKLGNTMLGRRGGWD